MNPENPTPTPAPTPEPTPAPEPAPIAPATPAEPIAPAEPVAPAAPNPFAAPETPATPNPFAAPAEPVAPVAPEAPAAPAAPAEPAAASIPGAIGSAMPNPAPAANPMNPADPTNPMSPMNPATPATAKKPMKIPRTTLILIIVAAVVLIAMVVIIIAMVVGGSSNKSASATSEYIAETKTELVNLSCAHELDSSELMSYGAPSAGTAKFIADYLGDEVEDISLKVSLTYNTAAEATKGAEALEKAYRSIFKENGLGADPLDSSFLAAGTIATENVFFDGARINASSNNSSVVAAIFNFETDASGQAVTTPESIERAYEARGYICTNNTK